MKHLSHRFALTAVSVAALIFLAIGIVDYLLIREELLHTAETEAKLIAENSRSRILALGTSPRRQTAIAARLSLEEDFDPDAIRRILTTLLTENPEIYGMAIALEPSAAGGAPFAPYYFRKNGEIRFADLASERYRYRRHPWYAEVARTHRPYWSEPYFDRGGGEILMATYSRPILREGRFVGVATADLSLKALERIVGAIRPLGHGYALLLSRRHRIIAGPPGTNILAPYPEAPERFDRFLPGERYWRYFTKIGEKGLVLGIFLPTRELFAPLHTATVTRLALSGIGLLLLIFAIVAVSRQVTRPLETLTALTETIARGDFDRHPPLPKHHDEVYRLALAFRRMEDALVRYIAEVREAAVREERSARELSIAHEIQMGMLARTFPELREFPAQSAALLRPARAVGGDLYDLFVLDRKRICLAVGDVSGKGIPAALFMAVSLATLRAIAREIHDPVAIVTRLNDTLARRNDAALFVTLFLAVFDPETGRVEYVNAGHPPPYRLRADTPPRPLPRPSDPVLGAFAGLEFHRQSFTLRPGEGLLLYTDGITEAFSPDGELFGAKRFEALLERLSATPSGEDPEPFLEKILAALEEFAEDREQSDDITLLLFQRTTENKLSES